MLDHTARCRLVLTALPLILLISSCGHNAPYVREQVALLNHQALELKIKGQYTQAIELARKAVSLSELTGGPQYPDVSASLTQLGLLLMDIGNYAEARPIMERGLKIKEQALALLDRAVDRDSTLTPKVQEYRKGLANDAALSLDSLALLLQTTGDQAGALALVERVLQIREQTFGPMAIEVARTLRHLGLVQYVFGDNIGARRSYERALKIYEQTYRPMHTDVAETLDSMAGFLQHTGNYAEARSLYERALKIREQVLGPTHPDVAQTLFSMAGLLRTTGHYADARPLYERALKVFEQAKGPMHPQMEGYLNGLAGTLSETGDYSGARPLMERALQISEQARGPMHYEVARNLTGLAALLQMMGDDARARQLLEQALKIYEQNYGPNNVWSAPTMISLAIILHKSGDYDGARRLLDRALLIREHALGPKHPDVAESLSYLGGLAEAAGDSVKARQLYERALSIREQTLGEAHPAVATSLNSLGFLLQTIGDHEGARPLYQRALAINEQKRGPTHPEVARVLGNLAILAADTGDINTATKLGERAVRIIEQHTRRGLLGLSERQKLIFLKTTDKYVHGYLSLPAEALAAATAYQVVLERKNLVFRVLTEERLSLGQFEDPAVRRLVERREAVIRELTGLTMRGGGSGKGSVRIADLERELEQVEAELSRTNVAFRQAIAQATGGPDDVCKALPNDTALLDYLRYTRLAFSPKRLAERWEDHYTVFVIRGGRCGAVQRVDLGPAAPIDQAAVAFRQGLAQSDSEATLLPKAQALGNLVLPPAVRRALAGVNALVVSPDGPLTVVPFGLLSGEEGKAFLLETSTIATIPSGRDLLRLQPAVDHARQVRPESVLLVGNPDYGATLSVTSADANRSQTNRRAGCALEADAEFPPLPGTAKEVEAIALQAGESRPVLTVLKTEGTEATETWVSRQAVGQRYIHLASHGYFAGVDCVPSAAVNAREFSGDASGFVGTNPLLLAGISLAGANRRAQATNGAEDGILTALEVTGLDLRGTDLIVLSACETGLGVQQAGQEVLGLRWAFSMAGSRSLLTSLWKVPDEPTVVLMATFYSNLWRSQKDGGRFGKAEALRQVQLKLMSENRAKFQGDSKPNQWAAWVLSGDWR